MPILLTLSPAAGEAELYDPAVTGQFAEPMAEMASTDQSEPWCGYIARGGDGVLLGFGGFKGAPEETGEVEIGYLTFPQHEGRGVAKAMAAAMVEIALSNGARTVCAHTLCEENASTAVLRANGFIRDGFGEDPDEGKVWRWKLKL